MTRKAFIILITLFVLVSCSPQGNVEDNISPWGLLKELILIPGVSGSEEKVADFIESSLPEAFNVQRDDMDNVWFTVGEGHPHLLFLAHTDRAFLCI